MKAANNENKPEVLVIGAGASGIIAAIEASRCGAQVTILEKENRIGKKLLATGNGRCNYANTLAEPRHFHGSHGEIIQSVLKRVTVDEILIFFEMLGVTPKTEHDGRVYPYSDQGSNVLDVLRYEMKRLDIRILTDHEAKSIRYDNGLFTVETNQNQNMTAARVILATGGKAGSQFGADGSGYMLALNLGHTLVKPNPALVQIKLEAPWLKSVKGVKWQGAASIMAGNKCARREQGELLFTDYGISGPPILQLSRLVHELPSPELRLHLLHEWTMDEVISQLMMRFRLDPEKTADLCLLGLFHKRLIPVLLHESGIHDVTMACGSVPEKNITRLAHLCENWQIPIRGTLSWQQAQVTAGGINTPEIRPDTMESTLVRGLYLTGEVMDVDGDCGGFNLYWAWATGILAGRHAAEPGERCGHA
jgi:predicted Rossmann fold flavoprotein